MGRYCKDYVADFIIEGIQRNYHDSGILSYSESDAIIDKFQKQSVAEYITELLADCTSYLIKDEMVGFVRRLCEADIIAQLLWNNRAYKRSTEVRKAIAEARRIQIEVQELREQVVINTVNKALENKA